MHYLWLTLHWGAEMGCVLFLVLALVTATISAWFYIYGEYPSMRVGGGSMCAMIAAVFAGLSFLLWVLGHFTPS